MLVFQMLLWAWLLAPSLAASLYGFTAGVFSFLGAAALAFLRAGTLVKSERSFARAYGLAFGLVSASWLYVTQTGNSFLSALVFSLAVWAALFLWFLRKKPAMDAIVLGYDSGFAIVRIGPSLVSWVPPGVYAVKSKPVKKAKNVQVRFDLFSKTGRVA